MRFIKQGSTILSLALVLGLAACGDDGNSGTPDGSPGDGGGVDATPTASDLRAGTVAILDTQVLTSIGGNEVTVAAGAVVSLSYGDKTMNANTPEPLVTTGVFLNGCDVTVFTVNPPQGPLPVVDEGPFAISGTKLLVEPCAFSAAAGRYVCPASVGTLEMGAQLVPQSDGSVQIRIQGADPRFAGKNLTGATLVISGVSNAAFNGQFGVIDNGDDNLDIYNPAAMGQGPITLLAGEVVQYQVLTGAGPIQANLGIDPNDPRPTLAELDFLGGNDPVADQVTITKQDGPVVRGFPDPGVQTLPSGQGLQLSPDSDKVYAFPATAAAMSFSCAQTDAGNCGASGTNQAGWVLSGITTDTPVTPGNFDMPPATTQFASFQCRAVGAEDITMPMEIVAAVLGTSPTRIETRLSRVTPELSQDATNIVVGHSLVGFTDIAQP